MTKRTIALITGAYGGMGQACARQLGRHHRLALCDLDEGRLTAFAEQLSGEGYDVAVSQPCDVSDPSAISALGEAIHAEGRLGAVAHTAGLSPALAPWRPILEVNLTGTSLLFDAITDLLEPGSAVVAVASMAAHRAPVEDQIDTLIDAPLKPGFADAMEAHIRRLSDGSDRRLAEVAYGLSKRGVVRMCERRALAWASREVRVVTVSPGLIATPMGVKEAGAADHVQELVANTPAGRWGTALDIAAAVNFLASPEAGFITGCDLKVDGGISALIDAQADA